MVDYYQFEASNDLDTHSLYLWRQYYREKSTALLSPISQLHRFMVQRALLWKSRHARYSHNASTKKFKIF